jgi:hypothetical protein
MASSYAHVLPKVMTDAAEQVGRALWGDVNPTATRLTDSPTRRTKR